MEICKNTFTHIYKGGVLLKNIFPGTRIFENFDELREEIILQMNPQKIHPLDNMRRWKRLDNEIYSIGKLEDYYLLYTHPIHNYLDKLL